MTRTILNRVFGLETYSEYNDRFDLGISEDVSSSVGHRSYEEMWDDFYSRFSVGDDIKLVKTHGPAQDDNPAIYIVRDPRSAIISQFHYFRTHPLTPADFSIPQLIDGQSFGGDWSSNLDAWHPLDRPHTLFLRYEEILSEPDRIIALISDFLKMPVVAAWQNPFERQKDLLPTFFRTASDQANLAEWAADDLQVLWKRHGDWMNRLGYGDDGVVAENNQPLDRPSSQIVSHWR